MTPTATEKEFIAFGAIVGISIALIFGLSYMLTERQQPNPTGEGATEFLKLIDTVLSFKP